MHRKLVFCLSILVINAAMLASKDPQGTENPKKGTCVLRLIENDQDKWGSLCIKKFVYRDGNKLVLGGICIDDESKPSRVKDRSQKYPHSIVMTWREFADQRPLIAQALKKDPTPDRIDRVHDTTRVRVCWGSEELLTKYLQNGSVTQERFEDFSHFYDKDRYPLIKRTYAEETYTYFPRFTNQVLATLPLFIEKDAWEPFKAKVKEVATEAYQKSPLRFNQISDDAQEDYHMCRERREKMMNTLHAQVKGSSEELIKQHANQRLGKKFIAYEKDATDKLMQLTNIGIKYAQTLTKNYQMCLGSLEATGIEIEVEHA